MKFPALLLSSVLLLTAGCGDYKEDKSSTPTPQPTPTPTPAPGGGFEGKTFTADVQPVFQTICTRCHTPDSGLPVNFLTDEAAAKGKALTQIKAGTMPKGDKNKADFAPFKDMVIAVLSRR